MLSDKSSGLSVSIQPVGTEGAHVPVFYYLGQESLVAWLYHMGLLISFKPLGPLPISPPFKPRVSLGVGV